MNTALYESTGAIVHDGWKEKRIDFQPYPFPSYTEELIRKLKTTLVLGKNDFLGKLDPAFVAGDLVDDRYVKKAIQGVGGMAKFGLPESYERKETISST